MYLRKFFPGVHFAAAGPTTRTPIEAAKELNQKYTDLIFVGGSDRAPMFKLLNDYNHKEYEFNSIEFVSAGDRDPDADDVSGVSGTKMRAAAMADDVQTFMQGLPATISEKDAMNLIELIKQGLQKPVKAKKGVAEEWSQKYKSSINCSHPKGFSQKAHCAGKKKHEESMTTMEAVCPDCGMCKTHGDVMEIKKGAKDSNGITKCWPGKHAEGTKKGKNGGQVRACEPNEDVEEGLKSKIAGAALAAANLLGSPAQAAEEPVKPITIAYVQIEGEVRKYNLGDKFSNAKEAEKFISGVLDKQGLSGYNLEIKHGYPKKKEGVDEGEKKGLYYYVNKRKKAGTSRDASHPKAPTAQAWKDAAKTAKKESVSVDEYMTNLESKLAEKLLANTPVDVWIKDFEKSNAPQFKGKSKEKRREMAIAASYGAKNPRKKK
jgi:hypothetical protein